jgi:hypothetical protein
LKKCTAGLALIAAVGSVLAQAPISAPTPVVIELFTSEGCSSCPPADRLLAELDRDQPVSGVQLIVLSEHVDYWNTLGWIDPYSSHQFSERQQRYGEALHIPDVYTPQAVVDGRDQVVGNSSPKLQAAVELARRQKKIPLRLAVIRNDKGIHVELHAMENAPRGTEVYIVLAEDSVASKVSAGENGGHMLTHTAVVRSLMKAGKLSAGGDAGIVLDLKTSASWGNHLRVIAFLAEHDGGKIVGAAATTL